MCSGEAPGAAAPKDRFLRFGPFRLDIARSRLLRDDQPVQLRPKAFLLLQLLVLERGRVVSKNELLERVWPDGFGSEANLTVSIAAVRKALGERPRENIYIATVPTEGYRFVAEVEDSAAPVTGLETSRPEPFDPRYTRNVEAFQLYLEGRWCYWNRHGPHGLRRAIEFFEKALQLDPAHALAYCGLAECTLQLWSLGFIHPVELMERTRDAAQRALALDDRLADAHRAMGMVLMMLDRDWGAALPHLRRALALDPRSAVAHESYVHYLLARGRMDEAIAWSRRAIELSPLSLQLRIVEGGALYFARRFEQAERAFLRVCELDEEFPFAHAMLGWLYLRMRQPERALDHYEKLLALSGESAWTDSLFAATHIDAGRQRKGRHYLRRLEKRAEKEFVQPAFFAHVYTHLGEFDRALDWLERADEARYGYLIFIGSEPLWDPLRTDPRFQAIEARVLGSSNLPSS